MKKLLIVICVTFYGLAPKICLSLRYECHEKHIHPCFGDAAADVDTFGPLSERTGEAYNVQTTGERNVGPMPKGCRGYTNGITNPIFAIGSEFTSLKYCFQIRNEEN